MYSSSASAGNKHSRVKSEEQFDDSGFDFGEDFPSRGVEQKTLASSSSPLTTGPTDQLENSDPCRNVVKETIATDGGWELRPSGCGGSNTTRIVHSQHNSDGSVTSDGSDRIIIKKTVDVCYES